MGEEVAVDTFHFPASSLSSPLLLLSFNQITSALPPSLSIALSTGDDDVEITKGLYYFPLFLSLSLCVSFSTHGLLSFSFNREMYFLSLSLSISFLSSTPPSDSLSLSFWLLSHCPMLARNRRSPSSSLVRR